MKKAGVPLTPTALAAAMSVSTSFWNVRSSTQALNVVGIEAEVSGMLLQVGGRELRLAFWKRRS